MKEGESDAAATGRALLLDDPDLVSHLPEVLRSYRESSPGNGEQADFATLIWPHFDRHIWLHP